MLGQDVNSKFNHLVKILSSKRFLECQILCNDVPFFIADYKIKNESEMQKLQGQLIKKLAELNVNALRINMYDIVVDILKETGDWEWYLENESTIAKTSLKEDLQSILDIKEVIIPKIKSIIESNEFDILFITGVGEVFPYLRSHSLLTNLQAIITNKPLLMFYPGKYEQTATTGSTFKLFDLCPEGQEYRAANIFEIQEV